MQIAQIASLVFPEKYHCFRWENLKQRHQANNHVRAQLKSKKTNSNYRRSSFLSALIRNVCLHGNPLPNIKIRPSGSCYLLKITALEILGHEKKNPRFWVDHTNLRYNFELPITRNSIWAWLRLRLDHSLEPTRAYFTRMLVLCTEWGDGACNPLGGNWLKICLPRIREKISLRPRFNTQSVNQQSLRFRGYSWDAVLY